MSYSAPVPFMRTWKEGRARSVYACIRCDPVNKVRIKSANNPYFCFHREWPSGMWRR